MTEWFSDLEFLPKVYWLIAIIGSLIFSVVMLMAFVGGDADDIGDMDTDIDADAGAGFHFISFKNLVGFFTIFGWSGIGKGLRSSMHSRLVFKYCQNSSY